MTKDEALKMAIEMLEKLSYEYGRLLDGDQDYGLLPSEINADIIKTYYIKRNCQEALEQSSWKKLQDDEIQRITWKIWGADALEPELDYARAIEQALKDKNT